ncbi:MAG TPA: hypothetical protein VFA57_17855 [Pseudolabrys sp.]|jgi:hypothetical protein|nr:hypothetical protein [Pseudolabrys sp.]
MKPVTKLLLGTAAGAGMLAFSAVGASAAIACSGNVCWHTHDVYRYPPRAHIVIHSDDWHWRPHEHFVFREHEGRGYWRGDRWVEW